MAVKTKDEIKLEKAYALKGIFPTWKQDFYIDPKKKIASIPFIRNIVEYTADQTDPRYMRLTSMLHVRDDTSAMTVGHLDSIFAETFSLNGASSDPNQTILALIRETADECLKAGDGINFENKIVLSIAIRLVSEQFMSTKINDPDATRNFASNQTSALYRLFRRHFPDERAANDVLRQVMLMTPESIHLNSFMYEPILDMSDEHLKRLYKKVVALS